MGEAPGNIGPGGGALGREQFGDVVEGDDEALDLFPVTLHRDADQQGARHAAADQFDLGLHQTAWPLARRFEQFRHLRNNLGDVGADALVEVGGEQRRGGTVGEIETAIDIETDHARRYPGKYRLHEPPPGIELLVGLHHLAALALELAGHTVERARQRAQLVIGGSFRHPGAKVPFAHPLGRRHQSADGFDQLVCQHETDPDRRQKQQQRHHRENHGEGDLKARTALFEKVVLTHGALGPLHMVEHPAFDEPADVKVGVEEAVESQQGAHPVVIVVDQQDDLPLPRPFQGGTGHGVEFEQETHPRTGKNPAGAVEDDGFRECPQIRLRRHQIAEPLLVIHYRRRRPVDVIGHGQRVGLDHLLMFLEVGFGDRLGFLQRRTDPLAEPGLDAGIEKQDREHGDDNGRRHGHQAEQHHQANLQP